MLRATDNALDQNEVGRDSLSGLTAGADSGTPDFQDTPARRDGRHAGAFPGCQFPVSVCVATCLWIDGADERLCPKCVSGARPTNGPQCCSTAGLVAVPA